MMSETGLTAALDKVNQIHTAAHHAIVDTESGLLPPKPSVRIIVAGGDGSVVWTVQRLRTSEHPNTPLAIIPLGTGNDMAGLLGWGVIAPDMDHFLTLAGMVAWLGQLRSACIVQHDVWQVSFSVQPGTGAITQIRGGAVTTLPETVVRLPCVNYSSIGMDARLVHAVELHRMGSRSLNRMVYGIAGCVTAATPTTAVTESIAQWVLRLPGVPVATTGSTSGDSNLAVQHALPPTSEFPSTAPSSNDIFGPSDSNMFSVAPSILGTYHTLMFLSAHSYGGGTPLWELATQLPSSYYAALAAANGQQRGMTWPLPQRCDASQDETDGVLEVLGSATLMQLGWTTSTGVNFAGGLHQLAKTSGLQIHFDPHFAADLPLQVDGEAYILKQPSQLSMELLGKATVLKRKGFDGIKPWLGKFL
jgi:hypothetical protein